MTALPDSSLWILYCFHNDLYKFEVQLQNYTNILSGQIRQRRHAFFSCGKSKKLAIPVYVQIQAIYPSNLPLSYRKPLYLEKIENPYIWKKLSLFSCIFIFPPYLCSDSAADSVPYLGILIIYCKHFTKIIPTLKIWKIFKSNGVMDSKCLRLSTDYVRSPICYRCIVLYRTSAGCCSIIVRRAFSRCLNVNNR